VSARQESAPALRVVRGDAAPEEIAALVAVLAAVTAARARQAAAAARDGGPARSVSAWADRSRGLRTPLPHGAGAWRASARPL
jgi:hypothetical protein